MPSFDIVSELNDHEVANAVDQANREVTTRFDFKGTGAKFELKDNLITQQAPSEFQLRQMIEILRLKLSRRGVDLLCVELGEPVTAGQTATQVITLKKGIDKETGKKIQKLLKESGLKVQAAIQGDQVRVTGKKRDDLQAAIARVKAAELGLPVQFNNFRD